MQPENIVRTCVDIFLEFSSNGEISAEFDQASLAILETTVSEYVQTATNAIIADDEDDVNLNVDSTTDEQEVYDDKVEFFMNTCITLLVTAESGRRLTEIKLPSVADIVAAVDEAFAPEEYETFTETLVKAADDAGDDAFNSIEELVSTEVNKIPPTNPTAAPTASTPCLDSTLDFLIN